MKNKKILIIDDDPKEFEALKRWVNSLKYDVLPEDFVEMSKAIDPNGAGDGIVEYIKRQLNDHYGDIGLILCDIVFGDAGAGGDNLWGGDIIKSIRNNQDVKSLYWTSLVPIIAVTQFADEHRIGVARDGADFVASKPKGDTEKKILKYVIETQMNKFEKYIHMTKKNKKKVFIVHGHGDLNIKVARFLEKLGLEAIILQERPNSGYTIIEKIEHNSDVGYAVVLYTACDMGKEKNELDLKPRARQNVVFEHGYMISKLGRNNVCALLENGVESPGDMAGVSYLSLEDSGWELSLAKEMKEQGMEVDLNKLMDV